MYLYDTCELLFNCIFDISSIAVDEWAQMNLNEWILFRQVPRVPVVNQESKILAYYLQDLSSEQVLHKV